MVACKDVGKDTEKCKMMQSLAMDKRLYYFSTSIAADGEVQMFLGKGPVSLLAHIILA